LPPLVEQLVALTRAEERELAAPPGVDLARLAQGTLGAADRRALHAAAAADPATAAAVFTPLGRDFEATLVGLVKPLLAPAPGWWARLARGRRWLLMAGVAGVATAGVVLAVASRSGPGGELAVALVVEKNRLAPGARGEAKPGDDLVVAVTGAPAVSTDVRVYRNDRQLVGRCGDPHPCRRQAGRLILQLPIPAPGRYRALAVTPAGVLLPAAGSYDEDRARLESAGGHAVASPVVEVW
jgi:hypothetical protein